MYNTEELRQKFVKSSDYKTVFGTDEGQRVLFDLMKNGCFLRPTHVPNDEVASHKNEGMRELFLYILYQVELEPEKIMELIKLNKEQDRKDRGNIYEEFN